MAEISDLQSARLLLEWDQRTMMPPLGAAPRAERVATLERLSHERLTSARTGELIEAAAAELGGLAADSVEARIISETRRMYEKDRQVPVELATERAQAASDGYITWVKARPQNDFAAYAPVLERNFRLAREYAACFEGYDDPYDVLLDDFVPSMRAAEVSRLFLELREQLVPLIAQLSGREVDVAPLHVSYPVGGQRQLVDRVLRWMGFDDESWRLDDTVHPFEASFAVTDVRLTTSFAEEYFPMALYGTMHECGHGLYEAGIDPDLQRTPLGDIRSIAVHESQSRLWENLVGRSRAFCTALAPAVAEHSQGTLSGLDAETLFRAVNAVKPSLIRIVADETTYGLHVILRFELEKQLLNGELAVSDLPEAWNTRMREYLGVEVPSNADGVMQDMHWSAGLIGYFPGYALGNLIAGQIWERARVEMPDIDEQLSAHELQPLREWLRVNVYQHGSRFTDTELLERVVGEPLTVMPFVNHLHRKLGDVYGLDLA